MSVALAYSVRAAEPRFIDDAALHAVQFVDPKVGWAVGDAGVVWHTIDGGATWESLPTSTALSLRSLHFVNALVGWVAGREELVGGGSVGVLLYTRDGGESWHRVMANTLPGINHIRFGDPKTGYLLCDASDQYPAGVFQSKDGGRTWQPLPGPRGPGYLTGDFKDGTTGALAGPWCRLATVRPDGFGAVDVDKLGGRKRARLAVAGPTGHRGRSGRPGVDQYQYRRSLGFRRFEIAGRRVGGRRFSLRHTAGEHVWVAGRPGSVILHSSNHGGTWKVFPTGQNLPLNGLFFFDEKRGWAVGEYGTILATEDGGKKWTVQQRGGQRAAVLFVNARSSDCPLDTVALLGVEEGHLTTAVRMTAADALRGPGAGQRSAAVQRRGASGGRWQRRIVLAIPDPATSG